MKKILYVMPLLAMALTACDPSEIEGGSEWSQFDINQLQATATPQEVNGMNGNVIHVVSNSPVVTAWDADQLIENTTHTVTTEGNIYVTKLGANIIRVSATNNGGSPAVKEITVQIDTISYITDAIKNRLCIGQRGAPTYFGKGFNVANITVSQTIDNLTGKPGNSINITKNTNPALCTFRWGSSSIDTNIGKIVTYALDEEQELFVDFQDARGVTATFSLGKFKAEAYSDLPAGIRLLTGYDPVEAPTATKTWTMAPENNWGNGGNNDKKPSWWTTTVWDQGGTQGTLTFDFVTGTLTKQLEKEDAADGDKSGSGPFSLDFAAENAETNVLFVSKTTEPGNIIHPIMINQGDYHPTRYEVTLLDEDNLGLRAQHTNDATWEGCFWVMVKVNE